MKEVKICKMCSMDIPLTARKCPYCQHFQNRVAMILFHPVFSICVMMIPLFTFWFTFAQLFDRGEEYLTYADQLEISESTLRFGAQHSDPTVVVLGSLVNHSQVDWKNVLFEVEFLNAEGKRVDVGQKQEIFGPMFPRNGTRTFKISLPREFPASEYFDHRISIISAKDASVRW